MSEKLANATAFAENVALLMAFSQNAGGICYLLSGVLAQKLCKSDGVHSSHTKHQFFFVMKREFVSPGFFLFQYWLLHRQSQASSEEITKCGPISHCVQTEKTNLKNVFLQPDHTPSKHEPPLSNMVAVVTILWSFMQMFSKHFQNFLPHFLADTYLKYNCIKTNYVKQCTRVKACCYIT